MRLALAFLTRLPVGGGAFSAEAFSRAAWWFPAVGLLVGGVVGGVRLLGEQAFEPGVATLLALLAGVLLTGGLHEDGLADVADAAGAHVSRERRLEILKDSRIGTFGGLALVFAVALAWAAFAELDGREAFVAAVCAHVLGRWAILPIALLVPAASASGSGALLSPSAAAVAVTGVLAAGAAVAAGAWPAVPATLVTVAACCVAWPRVFGGQTGDCLGATAKLVELAVFLALVA